MSTSTSTKSPSPARPRSVLPRILGIACLIGEIAAGGGFLAAIILIPFSQARLASGRESIRIIVPRGNFGAACEAHFGDTSSRPGDNGFGGLSIGPLRLKSDPDGKGTTTPGLLIRETEGTATVAQPADAARALEFMRWPFILSMLCSGATTVAILDLFRRMLGSVARGEVFTADNIRNVNRLGILFIASTVANLLLSGWLVNRFVAFVAQGQQHGAAALETFSEGNGAGIAIGLMIMVLAGVFRQGLELKEDSQLTI
jgi:hypothetical protein